MTAATSAGMSAHNVFMLTRVFSRTFDLLASLGVLALVAPCMLLTVIAIKLEDGWLAPAFCTQRRVGLDGRTFDMIKFRSTHPDAYGHPRVTRVGAAIRQLSIDELPKVFNVLRGQMRL